jgi:hypothetical protein
MGRLFLIFFTAAVAAGCASQWKIHGGPPECIRMCTKWNLEFAGMVGVGNQDSMGEGATACVCQVRRNPAQASNGGEAAASASLAGPITAAQAAIAANAVMQRQMMMQQSQPRYRH